jgi:hypothetical protein
MALMVGYGLVVFLLGIPSSLILVEGFVLIFMGLIALVNYGRCSCIRSISLTMSGMAFIV